MALSALPIRFIIPYFLRKITKIKVIRSIAFIYFSNELHLHKTKNDYIHDTAIIMGQNRDYAWGD